MKYLALDLSLNATGWALDLDDHGVETGPAELRGINRLERWARWTHEQAVSRRPDLAVIEGYAYGRGNQAHQIGELGGVVRMVLRYRRVPFVEIPPATVKKYATGKGNSPKPTMRMELYKRTGLDLADDNEVDALWILAAAHQAHGSPLWPMPKANADALDSIEWPL